MHVRYLSSIATLTFCATFCAHVFGASSMPSLDDVGEALLMMCPLSQAIVANKPKTVERYLQHGMKLHPGHLHIAVGRALQFDDAEGGVETVRILLQHGVPVGTKRKGATALIAACVKNKLSLVQMLCDAGASLQSVDLQGGTALHCAAFFDVADSARYLLQRGAYADPRDVKDFTPLQLAALNGSARAASVLADFADVRAYDPTGRTPLLIAMHMKQELTALALIEKNAAVEVPDAKGKTPMHIAAKKGMLIALQALLQVAPCDVLDGHKRTPLVSALLCKQVGAARLLIEAGVRLDIPNHKGNTPLHIAAAHNMVDIVNLLLARGAAIHARNASGKYPYQLATESALAAKLHYAADM